MLLNGINHAVVALQRNVVPPCLAWHSVMLLLKAGQTIIFGEEERSSWKVLIAAALLTKDTGFALDAGKDLADRQGLGKLPEHWQRMVYTCYCRKSMATRGKYGRNVRSLSWTRR